MDEREAAGQVAGFNGTMSQIVRQSAMKHPRKLVEISLLAWENVVLPSLAQEFGKNPDDVVRRIREELRHDCAGRVGSGDPCRLNKGHIGGCSTFEGVVTVSIERISEILNYVSSAREEATDEYR